MALDYDAGEGVELAELTVPCILGLDQGGYPAFWNDGPALLVSRTGYERWEVGQVAGHT